MLAAGQIEWGWRMTPRIVGLLALLPMVLLLLVVVREDVKRQRIPNALVFLGAGLGLMLNTFLPEGLGFVSQAPGGVGFWDAAAGLASGLLTLLPMYLVRVMGAGDVKLMAMVGAFLGMNDVVGAVLATFLAGGVLSLGFAWKNGVLRRTLHNIRLIFYSSAVKIAGGGVPTAEDAPESAGRFPYAVAIAVGTVGYLVWKGIWKIGWP